MSVNIDEFHCIKNCFYKNEYYSVRDNGAVLRHTRFGKKIRKYDNIWTFGIPNDKNGYMYIGSARIHRIVAIAFHGEPPTKDHIVDHIDTNRKNNRPENLRYLTKLENALNNPITRSKIIYYCGSIEAFLNNPKILRDKYQNDMDKNFQWMRQVIPEEAKNCLQNLIHYSSKDSREKSSKVSPNSDGMGEWIYKPMKLYKQDNPYHQTDLSYENDDIKALYPDIAMQRNWKTPAEFLCCPAHCADNPIEDYYKNLKQGSVFCKNKYNSSIIMEFAIYQNTILIICKFKKEGSVKPYALSRITYENGHFIHTNIQAYFTENGAYKEWTLQQGLEWDGGDSIDDYC